MLNEKVPDSGLHHIAIASADFDRSIRFYTEGLGMNLLRSWGEDDGRAAYIDIGDGSFIEIFANGDKEKQKNEKLVHLAIKTSDPDLAFKNALNAGATSRMPPTTRTSSAFPEKQIRLAFMNGPDNEVLEFVCFF